MFSSHWWDGPNLPGISVPLTAPGADLRPVGACSRRAIGGWNASWKRLEFWRWKSMNLKGKKAKKVVNNLICLKKKVCDFIPYYLYLLMVSLVNIGRGWDMLGLQNGCRCPWFDLTMLPLIRSRRSRFFRMPWDRDPLSGISESVSPRVIQNGLVFFRENTGDHEDFP